MKDLSSQIDGAEKFIKKIEEIFAREEVLKRLKRYFFCFYLIFWFLVLMYVVSLLLALNIGICYSRKLRRNELAKQTFFYYFLKDIFKKKLSRFYGETYLFY